METVLTGITTTGVPHIGNYVGAIRPTVIASRDKSVNSYYFLADYHSLVKSGDPDRMARSTLEVAASWLAAGLDPDCVFYRQSDIPEIMELTWVLTCMTAKGLMNRAHAYKAAVAENEARRNRDPDKAITMGLFSYPILMAADILMFKADKVPVGRDQIQHVEMARDIAGRFNHHYGETFVLPEAQVDENTAVLPGLDGRKMSKSYANTIPLFAPEKRFRKLIMRIKTNSPGTRRAEGPGHQRTLRHLPGLLYGRGSRGDPRPVPRRHRMGRDEEGAVRTSQRPAQGSPRGVRAVAECAGLRGRRAPPRRRTGP